MLVYTRRYYDKSKCLELIKKKPYIVIVYNTLYINTS